MSIEIVGQFVLERALIHDRLREGSPLADASIAERFRTANEHPADIDTSGD